MDLNSELFLIVNRQETTEIRFFLVVAGYRIIDNKRNIAMRKELHVTNVISITKDYHKEWLEHKDRI